MIRISPCGEYCRVLFNFPKYERVGLKDLCSQLHDVHNRNDVAKLTTEMYLSNMEPVLRPADALPHLQEGRPNAYQ